MKAFHITAGALAYIGLFGSAIDAILDAMDRYGNDIRISVRAIK